MNKIKTTNEGICIDDFRSYGIKKGKYGVALITSDKPCETAALFTKNTVKAAPVLLNIEKIKKGGKFQVIIANSGNANCCTQTAISDAEKMCEIASGKLDISDDKILVASTGIIGKKLEVDTIKQLTDEIDVSKSNSKSLNAAKAIMTTDTTPKEISVTYKGIKIGGIAKGAGMIAPDLNFDKSFANFDKTFSKSFATMLCFLTTNAAFEQEKLQEALKYAADESFNMLSIDGDMSTNDAVILMSNQKFRCNYEDFQYVLTYLCVELAKMMASDGEGATKFLEVEVKNAKTREIARVGAKAIVSSPLVKTAIFGENPNWGRIVSALGSAIDVDFNHIDIILSDNENKTEIVRRGSTPNLEKARNILKNKEIRIVVDLHEGKESATSYGCDLSYDYVKINAEYN